MKRKHVEKKSKGSGNALLVAVIIILAAGILFSGWKLISIYLAYKEAADEFASMAEEFTTRRDAASSERESSPSASLPVPESSTGAEADAEPEIIFQTVDLECGYTVNFEAMWETNHDVAAWISSDGTAIDYPVMHGATNDTYIHTNWKGSYSVAGSIFTNYLCSGYLHEPNTIIYGHNMKDGSMFHSIKSYASQSYYENHPYMWYVTPEANYVLYIVGGFVVKTSYDAYTIPDSEEGVRELLRDARSNSDFTPDYIISGLDADTIIENAKRMVVLSTCSYEFDNARYIIVAVPLLAH